MYMRILQKLDCNRVQKKWFMQYLSHVQSDYDEIVLELTKRYAMLTQEKAFRQAKDHRVFLQHRRLHKGICKTIDTGKTHMASMPFQ